MKIKEGVYIEPTGDLIVIDRWEWVYFRYFNDKFATIYTPPYHKDLKDLLKGAIYKGKL